MTICGYCKKEMGGIGYKGKTKNNKIEFEKPFCPHCKHEFNEVRY